MIKGKTFIFTVIGAFLLLIAYYMVSDKYQAYASDESSDQLFKPSELHNCYGGGGADIGQSIVSIDDSNYVIAGYTTSYGLGSEEGMIMKVDENGDVAWSRTFGGDQTHVIRDVLYFRNKIFFTGHSRNSVGVDQLIVGCLGLDGDSLWVQSVGNNDHYIGNNIYGQADGALLVTGYGINQQGISKAFVAKFSENGELKMSRSISTAGNERSHVILESNGDLFMGGTSTGSNGKEAVSIYQINDLGDFQGMKTFGTENQLHFGDMEMTEDGFIVAGSMDPPSGASNIFLIKLDKEFNIQWSYTMETKTTDKVCAIEWREGSGCYIAGESKDPVTGKMYILMVHTDKFGTVTCSVNLKSQHSEFPNDMLLSDRGELILTGQNEVNEGEGYSLMFTKVFDSGWDLPWKIKRLWLKSKAFDVAVNELVPELEEGPVQLTQSGSFKTVQLKNTCLFFNREPLDNIN